MPNIYYSSPQTPFAAATGGLLGSLEKFTKLGLDQQRVTEDKRQFDVRSGQQQQVINANISAQQQELLAQRAVEEMRHQELIQLDAIAQDYIEPPSKSVAPLFSQDEYNLDRIMVAQGNMASAEVYAKWSARAEERAQDEEFTATWDSRLDQAYQAVAPENDDPADPIAMQARANMRMKITRMRHDVMQRISSDPNQLLAEAILLAGPAPEGTAGEVAKRANIAAGTAGGMIPPQKAGMAALVDAAVNNPLGLAGSMFDTKYNVPGFIDFLRGIDAAPSAVKKEAGAQP